MSKHDLAAKNKKVFKITVGAALGMFAFAFALIPFYNVMCKQLGINGKTNPEATVASRAGVDLSRTVTVQFDTTLNENLNWEFHPKDKVAVLHPGEAIHTAYFAKNNTEHGMTVQAIPSVTPGIAAQYVKKLECFCFTQQHLDAGESTEMGLVFVLDPEIPDTVHTMTLSYTLFDVT